MKTSAIQRQLAFATLCLLLVCLLATHAWAQIQQPQRPFSHIVSDWNRALDQARIDIAQPELTRAKIAEITVRMDGVRREARQASRQAARNLESATKKLNSLGPAPEEEERPELQALRTELSEEVAFYRARVQQSDLAATRAELTLVDLVHARRISRLAVYTEQGPSPLSIGVWIRALDQLKDMLAYFGASIRQGLSDLRRAEFLIWNRALLLLGTLVLMLLLWPLRKLLLRRFGRNPKVTDPSYGRRLTALVVESVARGFIPTVMLLLLLLAVPTEVVNEGVSTLLTAFVLSMAFFYILVQLVVAGFAPQNPQWRIVPINPEASRVVGRRLMALSVVTCVFLFLSILRTDLPSTAIELQSVASLMESAVVAFFILSLLKRDLWRVADEPEASSSSTASKLVNLTIVILALVVSAVPILGLLGYGLAAEHIVGSVLVTGLIIALTLLLREITSELVELAFGSKRRSNLVQKALSLSEQGNAVFVFWVKVALNLVLYAGLIVLLLLSWGISWDTIKLALGAAADGLHFGDTVLSPKNILAAALLFGVLLTATRLLQGWLGEHFLPNTRIQPQLQHSITAGTGYVGVIIATVVGFAALGLTFQNIAIIAGALSVGIGFGLQNVVNNFVSGFILLVEHPVSVGDWVVVGPHEGYVKRINIRATEIETFTQASVIIPNSELISSPVINNTFKNRRGRFEVPIRVAFGSDIKKVCDLLLQTLRRHPQVLAWPEPYVLFMNFGESALEFEGRGYISDVDNRLIVTSELRQDIDQAFGEHGIEVPYPQRGLHLADIDQLTGAVSPGERDDRQTNEGSTPASTTRALQPQPPS